jgi:hypothetical protein
MLESVVDRLIRDVLGDAAEYDEAEIVLSRAFAADARPIGRESAARDAWRKACHLAIGIEGLNGRAAIDLGRGIRHIRLDIRARCQSPSGSPRPISAALIRAVADAHKHQDLTRFPHPVASDRDMVIVGQGFGAGDFGAGKWNGVPEVVIRDTAGPEWKFMAEAPIVIATWFRFLADHGAALPCLSYTVCNVLVYQSSRSRGVHPPAAIAPAACQIGWPSRGICLGCRRDRQFRWRTDALMEQFRKDLRPATEEARESSD